MDTYIIQLIRSNNRVIIPDFGAFIVKQGATKSISFNEFLKFNDGLLINFVAEKDQTDRIVARKKVNDYVQKITKELEEKGKYAINGMGTLIKKEKKIEFEQDGKFWTGAAGNRSDEGKSTGKIDAGATSEKKDETVQVNKTDDKKSDDKPGSEKNNSIGKEASDSIIKQPGKTYNVREPRKKETTSAPVPPPPAPAPPKKKTVKNNISAGAHNNRKRRKNMSPVMWSGAFIVIIVAAVLIWFFLKDNSGKNEPIDQSVVEQVNSADPFAKDSLNNKPEIENSQKEVSTPVKTASNNVGSTEKKTVSQTKSTGKRYYVVAGCFKNEAYADKYVKYLNTKGYNAEKFGMLGPLHAVCFTSYDSRKKAIAEMQKIRKDFEPHAWVLHY